MTRQWSNDGPVNGPQYYLIKRAIDINVMRRSYALEFLNFDINTVGKQAFLQTTILREEGCYCGLIFADDHYYFHTLMIYLES